MVSKSKARRAARWSHTLRKDSVDGEDEQREEGRRPDQHPDNMAKHNP